MGHQGAFGGSARVVTPEEESAAIAVLAVIVMTLAPEGRVEDRRLADALLAVSAAPALSGLAVRGLARTARDLQAELADRGPLRMLRALAPHAGARLAETALCLAARAALADGQLDTTERAMLERAAEAFRLPAARLSVILDVMAAAQRAVA
jgi:tellurite resistance protein